MTDVSRYLPRAYAQPLTVDLRRAVQTGASASQHQPKAEKIIEAEWRPLSGKTRPAAHPYRTDSVNFTADESTLKETQSPSDVASRYQQMSPQPQFQPGSLIDALA